MNKTAIRGGSAVVKELMNHKREAPCCSALTNIMDANAVSQVLWSFLIMKSYVIRSVSGVLCLTFMISLIKEVDFSDFF